MLLGLRYESSERAMTAFPGTDGSVLFFTAFVACLPFIFMVRRRWCHLAEDHSVRTPMIDWRLTLRRAPLGTGAHPTTRRDTCDSSTSGPDNSVRTDTVD